MSLLNRLPGHAILLVGLLTTGATTAFTLGVRPTVYGLFGLAFGVASVAVGLTAIRTAP